MQFKCSLRALSLLALFAYVPAWADTVDDERIWLNVTAQGKLPLDNYNWYAEFQPRWREQGEHLDQRLIRLGVNRKFSTHGSLWLGYGNILTHRAVGGSTKEDRLWQQLTYNFKLGEDIALQSRTRLEQRWQNNGSDVGHRIRQLVRLSKPFATAKDLSAIGWAEVFWNFNNTDWGVRSGLDQTRLFVGLGYAFTPMVRAEAGYLNQYINSPTIDRQNHIFSTTLSLNF